MQTLPSLTLTLADHTTVHVSPDNRGAISYDLVRGRRGWPSADSAPFLWLTWCAFSELRRSGRLTALGIPDDFDGFADRVVQLTPDDADDAEVDPTLPAAS